MSYARPWPIGCVARVVFLLFLGCGSANANADASATGDADGNDPADAATTDVDAAPPCTFRSKLGPHLLGDSAAAQQLLAACPRVAKWLDGSAQAIAAFRAQCPDSEV